MRSSVAELNNTGNSLIQQSCLPILVMKLWLNHWELPSSQSHLFICIKLERTFNLKIQIQYCFYLSLLQILFYTPCEIVCWILDSAITGTTSCWSCFSTALDAKTTCGLGYDWMFLWWVIWSYDSPSSSLKPRVALYRAILEMLKVLKA